MDERNIYIGVYNLNREKLCNIYDNKVDIKGSAYNISIQKEANGYMELEFKIPTWIDGQRNYRLRYLKNEHLICVEENDRKTWFIVKELKESISKRKEEINFTCPHLSSQLKNKNLYLEFDGDTSGIGTAEQLVEEVLLGTGWKLVRNDNSKIYEKDGKKEKIRTYKGTAKTGTYQMIEDLGELFGFYPKYISDNKTVELIPMEVKGKSLEVSLGKNLSSISRTPDTSAIVTRLYVEGEYTDDGYMGIDEVNPSGLNFLLNFDYYKEIGLFTERHEKALEEYIKNIAICKKEIQEIRDQIEKDKTRISELWGGVSFVLWEIENGQLINPILESKATEESKEFPIATKALIVKKDFKYRHYLYEEKDKHPSFESDDKFLIRFVDSPVGLIGAKEVNRDAKKQTIEMYEKDLEKNKKDYSLKKIDEIQGIINKENDLVKVFDKEIKAMYEEVLRLYVGLYKGESLYKQYNNKQNEHQRIEDKFVDEMGEMLSDGFYNDSNYVIGQEKNLYKDSVEILKNISRPEIKYNIDIENLIDVKGYENEAFELFDQLYLYDKEMGIEDTVWIDEITDCIDNPIDTKISISNSTMRRNGRNLTNSLNNIGRLSENLRAKEEIFERAKNIDSNGKFSADKIQGLIDITANKIKSTNGGWYTDKGGNIVFESVDKRSAMMLSSNGFLLANGKDAFGQWKWRTFGTGNGFRADEINAGYLSAERIESKSITLDKLDNSVGTSIDLSSNESITSRVKKEDLETILTQTKNSFKQEIKSKITEVQNVNGEMIEKTKDILSYQRFTKEGLEIGKEDSKYTILIQADKISFKEDGNTIAYFANNKMYVAEAETNKLNIDKVEFQNDKQKFSIKNNTEEEKTFELDGKWKIGNSLLEKLGKPNTNKQVQDQASGEWKNADTFEENREYKLSESFFGREVYEKTITVDKNTWDNYKDAYKVNELNKVSVIEARVFTKIGKAYRLKKANIFCDIYGNVMIEMPGGNSDDLILWAKYIK